MLRHNKLTPKEKKQVHAGNKKSYNDDRNILEELFGELKQRYTSRQGGYTRLIHTRNRLGDNAQKVLIEYI